MFYNPSILFRNTNNIVPMTISEPFFINPGRLSLSSIISCAIIKHPAVINIQLTIILNIERGTVDR